jgi:hypothetical protein
MNKAQLKKLIKPVVKECIQEVLIEEGLLTEVVSQVTAGLAKQPIVENKPKKTTDNLSYLMKTCKCSVSPERRIRNYKSIAESYWTQLAMMPTTELICLKAQSL